jgi:hypothetical protein
MQTQSFILKKKTSFKRKKTYRRPPVVVAKGVGAALCVYADRNSF